MQSGDPMELNFEGLEMEKLNITTDSVQRVDEKNGVVCLFIMFNLSITANKMSQMTHSFLFFTDNSKKIVTVWARYLSAPERSY